MINKSAIAVAAAAALFVTPLLAQTSKSTGKANSGAQAFVTKAANGGMFEVETSKMAVQRAKRADVKNFAQKMIDDHGKANNELQTVASKAGANVPSKMDASHKTKADKLSRASDTQFDQAYLNAQVAAHREAVSLFSRYAKSGKDADLKQFATNTLPTLEGHANDLKSLTRGSAAIGTSQGTSGTARQQQQPMQNQQQPAQTLPRQQDRMQQQQPQPQAK